MGTWNSITNTVNACAGAQGNVDPLRCTLLTHWPPAAQEQEKGYLESVEGGDDAYATKHLREFATVRPRSCPICVVACVL